MFDYEKQKILSLVKEINETFISNSLLSTKNLETTFLRILDAIDFPVPNKLTYRYFVQPYIVFLLLNFVNNSNMLSIDDRKHFDKLFKNFVSKIINKKIEHTCNFRVLGPNGIYPNINLEKENCKYMIFQSLPILITRNKISSEDKFDNSSEIIWITRNELKISTSLILAPESGITHLDFDDSNLLKIDYKAIDTIPDNLKPVFLFELLQIRNKLTPLNSKRFGRNPIADITSYTFANFTKHKKSFNHIFNKFSIQNKLLMRTSVYLQKAIMLWDKECFAEEAISNVFFCLEGCLHLIQNKHGNYSNHLDLNFVKKIFINNFANGEEYFEFISEAYEKRISLVHPNPKTGAEWRPFLMVEDYCEYFTICKNLLNYILIDRQIDD